VRRDGVAVIRMLLHGDLNFDYVLLRDFGGVLYYVPGVSLKSTCHSIARYGTTQSVHKIRKVDQHFPDAALDYGGTSPSPVTET
jgi:hypothetical protein